MLVGDYSLQLTLSLPWEEAATDSRSLSCFTVTSRDSSDAEGSL